MKTKWTKKEEDYLKKWYNKKSITEIAKVLKRSYDSVQRKAARLNLTISGNRTESRPWTEEEIKYLEKWFELKGSDFFAKKFNRTIFSVRKKAQSLGYNAYACCDLYVKTIANCFNSDSSVINRWINNHGLPCRVIKRGKSTCKLIDVYKFWEWAENNKDIIPWHKYELQSMLPEPEWVREMVRNSKIKNTRKPITSTEISKVCKMKQQGKTFKEIANELNRTVDSVKHIWRSDKEE